ncbi:TetR/AcrR family transcriptional regulator [Parvibaculum sp.]|uniref:TetR/AcrR family transcriptional regulator n=1 Tax=Parvibaculum sp. TaxID=2024848 RepID=UPI001AFF76DC|nr:TetR/AcrR family transcriptional regulator [Parvibaculum sp.]MBO6636380.1 TetR/AcrR family transcriptional regulator [Parvibaculum sp.]MBO6677068.1 TetR/AcrR family transcriptional regulator [Parvibaculum sp.]MBO6684200.1 TetR/AcrR family transcriptional regulator [Parvibaculum sp.]MBO6905055.1 TetR/AcrR family transcriptional regulator [Parvibaculum sp.]
MTAKGGRQDTKKPARKVGRPATEAPNEAKRDAIAAAALELFSRSGVAAVSNKELGEAAGINPALIYYYFEDKEDLFQFVVRKALSDALGAYDDIKREQGGVGDLDAWLSSNLLLFGEITRFLKVILDYAHSGQRSAETDAVIARFYDTETELIGHALREEGVDESEAEDLANLVSVFLDGVMVARVVRPDISSERLVRLMRDLLRRKAD